MPNSGIVLPIMGMTAKPSLPQRTGLADALFSATQQKVLGYLFGQPDRSFYATELIGLVGAGSGGVQREMARLAASGLVTVARVGNQKHYQANPESPIYAELCAIARKTFGLAEPLRAALAPLADRIEAAFVFGSVAKREDTAASDIDLMLISGGLGYADVFAALETVSGQLGRVVNPTLYTRRDFTQRLAEGHAFVTRVWAQPKLWLIGREDGFTA